MSSTYSTYESYLKKKLCCCKYTCQTCLNDDSTDAKYLNYLNNLIGPTGPAGATGASPHSDSPREGWGRRLRQIPATAAAAAYALSAYAIPNY